MKLDQVLERYCPNATSDVDLHTHTFRCKHAVGDVIDYARVANACGLQAFATTDHGPYADDRWLNFRMSWSDVDSHTKAIELARTEVPISVISGFEYEYVPYATERALADLRERLPVELVLFGPHVIPRGADFVNAYTEICSQHDAIEYLAYCADAVRSGLFDIAAHPDLFTRFINSIEPRCQSAVDEFVRSCLAAEVTCEFNATEFALNPRAASYTQFWATIAQAKLPVIVSSDAHDPRSVNAGRMSAATFAKRAGLHLLRSPQADAVCAGFANEHLERWR